MRILGSWAWAWAYRYSIPLVGSSDDIFNVTCARNVIWATFQHISGRSRPVVIGPHTKCMTSMTSMTSTARVRARSRAPYIRKLFFLILIFSKFQSDCRYGLIQENRKMPSEWLGVHGGRSYGPVPRGKRLPGPAVHIHILVVISYDTVPYHSILYVNKCYSTVRVHNLIFFNFFFLKVDIWDKIAK